MNPFCKLQLFFFRPKATFRHIIITLSLLFTFQNCASQTPASFRSLELKKPREITIFGFNAAWTAANYLAFRNAPTIPKNPIYSKVPVLDDFHRYHLNKKFASISDGTGILTCLTGALFMLKQPKDERLSKGIIMCQSLWLSVNLTQTVKQLTLRARPYTMAPGFVPSKKDDFYSFYSGHSAAVASIATSAWLMRTRSANGKSFNEQKTIPLVCTILGLSTALLRIYAGKHYPSDVLCGITTGMGIAYLNYRIHEK